METRKYPSEIQIFLFANGEINAHPVFDDWELMDDYYHKLPTEEKLAFEDTLDLIIRQNRKKLEKIEKDELGRKILYVKGIQKYFKL
jgi:hypothetical protein